MIRKLTVFLSTPVRKRMESDHKFAGCPGIQTAISFPNNLIRSALKGSHISYDEGSRLGGYAYKLFLKGYAEHDWVQEALYAAKRVEAVIEFNWAEGIISLEILFFKRGEKAPIYTVEICIKEDTGIIDNTAHSLNF